MLDILLSTSCKRSIIVTTDKIKAIKQHKIPDTDNQQISWAGGYLSDKILLCVILEKGGLVSTPLLEETNQ